MASLTVFIDALAWHQVGLCGFDAPLDHVYPLVPGHGYSINLQAELFTGKKPKELGYFNEWQYAPKNAAFKNLKFMLQCLQPLEKQYHLDRVAHRVLSRWLGPVANIPYAALAEFNRVSGDVFQDSFVEPTVFSAGKVKLVSFRDVQATTPIARDQAALDCAEQICPEHEHLAVTLMDLDSITHAYGVDSDAQVQHLKRCGHGVSRLMHKFLHFHPDAKVLVCSDHGMVNVDYTHELNAKKHIGCPQTLGYRYFVDSTYIRFWCDNDAIKAQITRFLEALHFGHIIQDNERKIWGLDFSGCGDILFQLHAGHIMDPTFFGRARPKAMHGYAPQTAGHHGVVLSTNAMQTLKQPDVAYADDVWRHLSTTCWPS